MYQTLNTCTKDCDIHTIGLGREHDPFFLEKLLTLRPLHSTYLFVIDETGIELSFKAVKDMIYLNNIKGNLFLFDKKGKKQRKFQVIVRELEQEDEQREWEIFHKLDFDTSEIELDKCFLTISVSNGAIEEKYMLPEIMEKVGDKEEEYKFHLIKVRNELSKILAELKHQTKANNLEMNQMDEYNKTKDELFAEYHEVFLKIFKIKSQSLKKTLFAFCEDLTPLMSVIEELLSSAYIAKIKNEVLAKAIQISHKNIKKKRYVKELKSRITDTVKLFNSQDESLAVISSKLSQSRDVLYEKYKKTAEDLKCFLTCYDFIEAISDQDCLCITFDVSRTEACIVAPHKIKITSIYPTIISAQSFLSSVKYSLNLNFTENSINKEHIIKGIAQESINAALPVFLCKEHWEVAKMLMDRILGWIVTLDPLGYIVKQKMIFPFLLLEFNIVDGFKKGGSSFTNKYFRMIIETCLNLLIDQDKETKYPLKDAILKDWNHYVNPGDRLPENIEKCNVLLLFLLLLSLKKKLLFSQFYHIIKTY